MGISTDPLFTLSITISSYLLCLGTNRTGGFDKDGRRSVLANLNTLMQASAKKHATCKTASPDPPKRINACSLGVGGGEGGGGLKTAALRRASLSFWIRKDAGWRTLTFCRTRQGAQGRTTSRRRPQARPRPSCRPSPFRGPRRQKSRKPCRHRRHWSSLRRRHWW